MKNMVMEKVPQIIDSIVNFFKELPNKMMEIGKNIVEGLWNGISNAKDWMKEKVSSFATGILDGMKNALGIHSPSTLFRDEVGRYMAEGIGVGFMGNLRNVMNNMRNALIDQTGNLKTNVGITGDFKGINGKLNNLNGNTTNTVQLNIYTQHLDRNEMNNIVNYVNERFGLAF